MIMFILLNLKEKAQRFDDMFKSNNNFKSLDPVLSKEVRNTLPAVFKNDIFLKRASWSLLNRKKEDKKNSHNV